MTEEERKEEGLKEPKSKESFWGTLPGIITGITAAIIAVAALVNALSGAGLIVPWNQTHAPAAATVPVPETPVKVTDTTIAPVPETTPLPFTVTIVPPSARRGYEVTLVLSLPVHDYAVRLNGRQVPVKPVSSDSGVITIPADAASGTITVTTPDGETASVPFTVLPDPASPAPTSSYHGRAPPAP